MASEKDLIQDVLEAETSAVDFFQPLWDEATRNKNMQALDHWTDAEKETIEKQKRIPYVFDEISHPINVLLGTQRDTRFDIKFYERNPEDAIRAEILNATWKYFADLYDFLATESDVFQDGITSKYGVFGCRMDYDKDYRGNLRIERVPYDELIWDTNFRQYDRTDAYWEARIRYFQRKELMRKYPDRKDLIEGAGLNTDWAGLTQRQKEMWFKPENDIIGTREYYEKDWVKKYYIFNLGSGEAEGVGYSKRKDAEDAVRDIYERYDAMVSVVALSGQQIPPRPNLEVQELPIRIIKKSVVLIDGVLEEPEEMPMNEFPHTVYFPYFNDGKFWSVVDRLYYPQVFTNRLFSMVDHWVGTMAKGALWIDPRTTQAEEKRLVEAWGKTGGVVKSKYKPEVLQSAGPAPQLFTMLEYARQNIVNNLGGANILGQKQTASESGRAVLARQAQAGLDNFVPLDNLRRTKQNLGEKIAWYLTNEVTHARKLRIVGDELALQMMQMGNVGERDAVRPNVRYVEVNSSPENTIEGLEVDVVVDESAHTTTKMQATIASMVDAAKAGLITIPPPPSAFIKVVDLPMSIRQEWLAYAEAQMNAPKEPTNKVSINYKDIPVDAQKQALENAGIESSQQQLTVKALDNSKIVQNVAKAALTPKETQMGSAPMM